MNRFVLRSGFTLLLALAGCSRPSAPPAGPPTPASPAAPFETVEPQSVLPGLAGGALIAALRADYTPERTLGYGRARDLLFTYYMRAEGRLRDPYTGYELVLPPGDPSTVAFQNGINTEHTWPQSKGARDEPLRSDMHHLYPVRDNVNSSRGNLPFGDVPDEQADAWYTLDLSQSRPPTDHRERWSERGVGRWEPRQDDKGNVARAVFYVYALYGPSTSATGGDAFFAEMRPTLLQWTRLDPVDPAELARSAWIATQQGTPNPFVLDPTLADRAFGQGVPAVPLPLGATPPRGAQASGPQTGGSQTGGAQPSAASDLWISAFHYDNAGEDRAEGVRLSGLPGARLAGWSLSFYNGDRVYRTVPLSGALDGSGQGITDIEGLQNGPADGIALVGPDGRVVEFLSYEGTIVASEGPARGQTSQDVGVAEDGRSGPGEWIERASRTSAWRLGPR